MPPSIRAFWDELSRVLSLLTRLPFAPRQLGGPESMARALGLAPLAGLLVALWTALVYWLAEGLGLGTLPAAALAVTAGLALTGGLHEDGLADLADGLAGGRDRRSRLTVMEDPRIGSFGALALFASLMIRVAALAELAPGGDAAAVLIAAHALARAPFATAMIWLPAAKPDGLGAGVGRPPARAAWTALTLGCALALLAVGAGRGLLAILVAAVSSALVLLLVYRRLGGYTGDALGALEQCLECLLLLTLVATR